MFKWLWNPVTAWQLSTYVTLGQMAVARELWPGFYEGTMNFIAFFTKPVAMLTLQGWEVSKELVLALWNTS